MTTKPLAPTVLLAATILVVSTLACQTPEPITEVKLFITAPRALVGAEVLLDEKRIGKIASYEEARYSSRIGRDWLNLKKAVFGPFPVAIFRHGIGGIDQGQHRLTVKLKDGRSISHLFVLPGDVENNMVHISLHGWEKEEK